MDSLTESEMKEIVRLQRDEGVQLLSSHFSWPEFDDERLGFHQEFVYDAVMFAADSGFTWASVIQAAETARSMFPQLNDLDPFDRASLLANILYQQFRDLTLVQQCQFAKYLTDVLVARRRLFQAVVRGASNISIAQKELDVYLPPKPCPLVEGMDVQEWEAQQLELALQQKEEELMSLQQSHGVSLRNVHLPKNKGVKESVRTALKSKEGQIRNKLNQEVNVLNDIMQLKGKKSDMATSGRQSTTQKPATPTKAKKQKKTPKS